MTRVGLLDAGAIAMRCALGIVLTALAVATNAANPEVRMASGPLFNGRANIHPNLLLSLSVEFPTVGIAYRGDNGTYNRTFEYVGYFNPKKCYQYKGSKRNPGNDPNAYYEDLYFVPDKNADALHECGNATFSGNFMNWAASSAIDMVRYALTGGDRILDTGQQTILQRAVLRDSAETNFYAHNVYFPRRVVTSGGNASAPGMVTPFDVKTLYIVSCRNRILFSDVSSGTVDSKDASKYCTSVWDGSGSLPKLATDKKLGDYLVRVKVCDDEEGPQRADLCQKYGNAYKPVGQIQRHAEKLRVGAMGYLLDDNVQRYGGVLRAPMKYVGPLRRDAPDFIAKDNDLREWDPASGRFHNNPEVPSDRDGNLHSGVLNYLNKFGRSGNYKSYDPVSELYYEGIRYFQGKGPTPEATSGIADSMKDGFPVITTWKDPVIASCQKNYILNIADVNTHWDRFIPGNKRTTFGTGAGGSDAHDAARAVESANASTPALDVVEWTRLVGEMESDASGKFGNPSKNSSLAGLEAKDTGASGHGTYYMPGLAYWANTHDIRLDKPTRVKTFVIDVDEGGNGLIDGSNRSTKPRDSQLYLAAKYGGFDAKTKDNNPFITLDANGQPVSGSYAEWSNGKTAAAVPSNYFLAGQPKEMISAIGKVFALLSESGGTVSGVSVSTSRISTDGAYVFQPGFDSASWSGSLKKLKLALGSDEAVHIANTAEWDAGELLTGTADKAPSPAPEKRKIFTSAPAAGGGITPVEFKWSELTDSQKVLLDTSPTSGQADGLGSARLDYLRGDRTREADRPNGIFRTRKRVLGDIINGNPVYVGAPSTSVQGSSYQTFYKTHVERAKTVYVGANDGMLHAFDASNGTELFAYAPNALFPGLNRLTAPEYEHQPYMDGAVAVGEAYVGNTWKTVLAAGMGGGAQGVFALDVSDPSAFANGSKVLFEFTDTDDSDIGNVTGVPGIAKFRVGMKNGVAEYKYFAVVASGFNNYMNDGADKFNNDAAGSLFLLALDKSPAAKWQLGVNYFKFRTPATEVGMQNGLSAPALVTGADGAVRYAYAGDLQGNLWRFDFTGTIPWTSALAGSKPLFVAKDSKGNRQPVTAQPRVVFAPEGGYVVLFGTGKFVENDDAAKGNFSTQTFYGVLDALKGNYAIGGRAELAERKLEKTGGAFAIAGTPVAYDAGSAGGKGWFFDFMESDKTGERSVTNPMVISGLLFFNTLMPGSDPCDSGGGRSYVVDTLNGIPVNGGVTGHLSTVGMLSAPVPFETAAEVGDRNAVGRRTLKKKYSIVNFGTGSGSSSGTSVKSNGAVGEKVEAALPAGRFSWREIPNWQELSNAAAKK